MAINPDALPTDDKKQLQRELKTAGYYTGEIDGIWGPLSQAAFARAQAANIAKPGKASALSQAIIGVARKYVGLSEIKANDRWDDLSTPGPDAVAAELRRRLLDIGWQPGYAYCIAWAKTVWAEAFDRVNRMADFSLFSPLITLGVVDSFNRLKAAGKVTNVPVPGAIFFLRHGSTGNGHAGIVLAVGQKSFATIEANTSPTVEDTTRDREGDGIYSKSRPLDFTRKASGLWLLGFCNPE